jgi:hypothetical protein
MGGTNAKTLGAVLQGAPEHSWRSSLYLETEVEWRPQTRAQVVQTDRFTLEPIESVEPGLRRVLSMQDVQQVVTNARAQVATPTIEQLVEALRYYALKDAFITFTH